MSTNISITQSYIDYVLTKGERPPSVYVFAKKNKLSEAAFYGFYASFDALEQDVWADMARTAIREVKGQEVWSGYTSREKMLSFFYGFFELLRSSRSFAVYSLKQSPKSLKTPRVLEQLKTIFIEFSDELLAEGLESGELADRKFFTKRYKDALWAQFGFVLNFWLQDDFAGFEKTDEAIEKGLAVTFDLFERSPIDNLFEYGKFIAQNSDLKEFFKFSGAKG